MNFVRRLRFLFRRQRAEAEMAEEMRFHLEQRAADYAEDGLSATDARYAAQRKFGNVGSLQELAREARGWGSLERFLKDLRFALRQLFKSPSFTLLAIVTLALGIGANTAMFSVLNAILLKPVPYLDHAGLDQIYRGTPQNPDGDVSPADFLDLRRAQESYGEVAAHTAEDASLSEPGRPAEMVRAVRVTANFLSLLGTQPQLGRDFRPGEDTPGRDRLVVLSQRTWRNRFGSEPDVIGRTIRIDGEPHQIIGVLPESFNDWRHLGWVDLFRPLALDQPDSADRTTLRLSVIGRRSGARSRADTDGFIASFGARLATDFPEANAKSSWRAVPLDRTVVDQSGPIALTMLVGLSGFVLLIACSNLANLLLARTISRAREFAVRAALGASRLQLLRPLVAESLLLALAGGGGAILVARWMGDWLAVRSTGDNGEQVVFALDWRVLGWALTASLVTALVFGIAPALFALRLDLNDTLKSGGRGAIGGRGHQRFRQVLIVGQFALAMVLLAGAGLFIRGLHDLNHRRAGWTSEHLVTGSILLPSAKYPDAGKITAFHRLALERLASLPGVTAVGISSFAPFFLWPDVRKFIVEGHERPELGREPAALVNNVSPAYFDTVGTRVLSGRAFNDRDIASSTKVFIVSRATAKGLFGDADPIGRRLAQIEGENLRWGEIVGVVSDVKPAASVSSAVSFQVYQAMAQEPRGRNEIAVRTTAGAPSAVIDSIRTTMTELDPDLPVRRLMSADARISRANYTLGVLRDMLISFALLGLALASLGIYGVIARTMAQRTGEFAIRLALGACVRDITRLVLASGVRLALVGSGIGLLGAFGVSRILTGAFPGMQINDPVILVATTLLLIAIALLACWLPARRAGKVDAMSVLRAE